VEIKKGIKLTGKTNRMEGSIILLITKRDEDTEPYSLRTVCTGSNFVTVNSKVLENLKKDK